MRPDSLPRLWRYINLLLTYLLTSNRPIITTLDLTETFTYWLQHTKIPRKGTDGWLLIRGKIRLPKVEHPKFEGHMTPNEDEYQNSVRLCTGVSQFAISLLFWLHTYWPDSLWSRPFSHISDLMTLTLTLDRVIRHTVMYHSSTSTYTQNFV